jgi:hypothetical protein
MTKFNAVLIPVMINGMTLAFSHAAFTAHKTADMADCVDQYKI